MAGFPKQTGKLVHDSSFYAGELVFCLLCGQSNLQTGKTQLKNFMEHQLRLPHKGQPKNSFLRQREHYRRS